MNLSKVHIALPAFNEASTLHNVLGGLRSSGFQNIIVVNDGSHDETAEIASSLGAVVISHLQNRGAGAASQTSIDYAKRHDVQYLILMDADGQHHTEDALKLLNNMVRSDFDVIIGNRFELEENQIPRTRIILNSMASRLTNIFCKNNYVDTQSGFRILNRKAIESLDLKVDGYGFCSEMIIVGENSGLKIGEVPIRVEYTEYSMSKGQSFANGLTTAFNFIWRILFN